MVDGMTSSSSSRESSHSNVGEKELLEFYQKRFDQLLQKDDKYREKIDRHLRELVADRYELEAEVLRRGEKISDLQRAVVDLQLSCFEEKERYLNVFAENEQLKKNEERLHECIRELLNSTKEKDLRDRIIYVLQDPSVDICYRHNDFKSTGTHAASHKKSTDDFLKEQVQTLQDKLDEYSKISKSRSDIVIEDCKLALERSREKLLQNEEEFRKLQNKLQETEAELFETKKTCSDLKDILQKLEFSHLQNPNFANNSFSRDKIDNMIPKSAEMYSSNTSVKKSSSVIKNPLLSIPVRNDSKMFESFNPVVSNASDMHLSLVMLSKILAKLSSILNNIQSTEVFVQTAKLPKPKAVGQKYVTVTDITQLQNYIRQCTRLAFDIKNIWKSLEKAVHSAKEKEQFLSLQYDLRELESAVDELAVATTEVDLSTIGLERATFFEYLTGPKQSFEKFGVKEMNNHSKYVTEIKKIEANLKAAKNFNSKAVQVTEKIIQKSTGQPSLEKFAVFDFKENAPSTSKDKVYSSSKAVNTESKGVEFEKLSKSNLRFEEKSVMTEDFPKFTENKLKENLTGRIQRNPLEIDDVTRKINKALAKISHIESGEYFKDEEFTKHFGEQVNALVDKLKALYDEFNVKSLHDQFAEYSSLTFSKLETLAKQSRDAVIAAEAQISAQRTNARHLSQKLRNAEDLLRESVEECLRLKQKLQIAEIKSETDKLKFRDQLQERLYKVQDFEELETAVKEVASSIHPSKEPKRPAGPYECFYCKQGSDHKLCEEKIKELRTNNRKLATEIKLLQQEVKEEKKIVKLTEEQSAKAVRESTVLIENLKGRVQDLESRNASLQEQLKLDRHRLKKMERFRHLEIEGFQTDVRNLKSKIQEMERQLGKAVTTFEHDRKDLELLQTIHTTTQHSQQAAGAIKRLKAKLYELERDFKHL